MQLRTRNFAGESANMLQGEDNSPSRQVLSSITSNLEHVDKQTELELLVNTVTSDANNKGRQRPGHRAHNKQKCSTQKQTHWLQEWWNSIGTIQDINTNMEELRDLQLEVKIKGDNSLFTWTTDPHNPRHI